MEEPDTTTAVDDAMSADSNSGQDTAEVITEDKNKQQSMDSELRHSVQLPATIIEKHKDDDGFLSPISLPPVAKATKKQQEAKPLSMAFKSKFTIPADIYKAPKVAMFMTDMSSKKKKEASQQEEESTVTVDKAESKSSAAPKPPPAKLTYEEPEWSSVPEDEKYSLEVLKMGSIVDQVKLSGKEYFLVGRLSDCDIKLEHPSISRYHAVLQYGAPKSDTENVELQKDGSHGFYIYDLGSTHGTLINKQAVRPKIYYRVKVGHVVKFGGSTRLFIIQGPLDDQEEEAKETATELRQYNKQKIKKKKDLERMMLGEDSSSDDDDENKRKQTQRNVESSGVTWGMLEDAVESSSEEEEVEEEEGDSRADHPDAIVVQTKKDPFYMKDPVKALKNLYEREKLELDFECDERRSGNWHVKLCLPIDGAGGKPVYAEVNATGKKKDTIRQCALEACRVLERHRLFHRKEHIKQKVKQWDKDDYYDSDEDEFHDRTGELQMKRKMRMQRAGRKAKASQVVETYESLIKQVADFDKELKDIETKLQKDREATKVNADALDPLDAFMQQVKSGKALDTTTRSKLKRRLFEARKERMRVSKLADLARPSTLPPLANSSTKSFSFIGKMKGKKKAAPRQPAVTAELQDSYKMEEGEEAQEEVDEEEEGKKSARLELKPTKIVKLMDVPRKLEGSMKSNTVEEKSSAQKNTVIAEIVAESKTQNFDSVQNQELPIESSEKCDLNNYNAEAYAEKQGKARVLGPSLPPELLEQFQRQSEPASQPNQEAEDEETPEPKRKRRRVRKPRQKIAVPAPTAQYSDDPKISVWLPPEDQSGDGKTSLNEKLGY